MPNVNGVELDGVASGSAAIVKAVGGDTNVDLSLAGQGTGSVKVAADRLLVNSIKVSPYHKVHYFLQAAAPATAGNYVGPIFIADRALELVSATVRFTTKGGASALVQLVKTASGTAVGAGTAMLTTAGLAVDSGQTNDTNVAGVLHATQANYQLAAGDAIHLSPSGTLTGLTGLAITLILKAI